MHGIAAGYTNRAISAGSRRVAGDRQALYHHLYGKLEVTSRAEAIQRAEAERG